jgi:hypothetical protein
VPVTKIMVGVKIKKMLLVNAPGRDTNPILAGLYLPTRIEVEAATAVFAAALDDDEEGEEGGEDGEEVVAVPAVDGPWLLAVFVFELLLGLVEEGGLVEVCD